MDRNNLTVLLFKGIKFYYKNNIYPFPIIITKWGDEGCNLIPFRAISAGFDGVTAADGRPLDSMDYRVVA